MSAERDFPELVRAHLPSVWSLELLLLLKRASGQVRSPQALCDELRGTLPMVQAGLERLERSGLAARDADGGYRYLPATPLMAEFSDAIERQYRERPVSVINLIVAPEDRLQQLADAFRFRNRDP